MNINAAVAARRCTITSVDAGADVQQNIGDTITWALDAEWDGLTVIAVVGFPRTRTYIELPIVGGVTQLPRLGADVITLGCYAGDGSTALRSSTSSWLILSRSVLSDRGTAVVINPADLGDMDAVGAEDKLIVLRSSDGAVKRALVSALPSGVDSVNGQTGAVVLTASDVGADASGAADAVASEHNGSSTAHSALFAAKQDKVAGKGLSTNDYTTAEKTKLAGIAAGAEANVQSDWNETDDSADGYIANKPTIPSTASEVGAVPTTRTINAKPLSADITLNASDIGADASGTAASAVAAHNSSATAHAQLLEDTLVPYATQSYVASAIAALRGDVREYGVRFTGSVSAGERLYDAVGLRAGIGIGAAEAENDFDRIMPWAAMRRCNTKIVGGERVLTFYEGEAGFSNTAADVFVYVPLFFYHRSEDDAEHVVSMQPLSGFVAPAKFRRADNSLRDYVFLPAYTSGLDANGVPVSRSGYYPHIASLNGWMSLLTTKHTALTLDADVWIEGTKDDEIKNILLDIEFATRDHQTFMLGASNMRYAADTATAGGTNQFELPAETAAYYRIGQIIAIGTADKGEQVMSRGQITAIENGVITFEAMGGANVTVAEGNFISSRPWKSGACDGVKASSGAPANDGYYPCVYRGIENPWGNQFRWRWDYLQNDHAPSILLDPTKYAAGAITADYEPLSYTVPAANGYATEMGFDPDYPFARVTKAVGGSSTTYFADYFYQSAGVRALRVGGVVTDGRFAGSRSFRVNFSPSDATGAIGAALSPA